MAFADVSRRLERFPDQARVGPVLVERSDMSIVMPSASEYGCPACLYHVALLPGELNQDDFAALRSAVVTAHERSSG